LLDALIEVGDAAEGGGWEVEGVRLMFNGGMEAVVTRGKQEVIPRQSDDCVGDREGGFSKFVSGRVVDFQYEFGSSGRFDRGIVEGGQFEFEPGVGGICADGFGKKLQAKDCLFECGGFSGGVADSEPRVIELFSGFGEAEAEEGVDSVFEGGKCCGASFAGGFFKGEFEALESASEFEPGGLCRG
jgi:hypothetical protein